MSSLVQYIKYLIEDCYEEDYNPDLAQTWRDNYCFQYSFKEWYFKYRKNKIYKLYNYDRNRYYVTPDKLLIGGDVYYV